MKWFLVSSFTINVLNVFILIVFMIWYLVLSKGRSKATHFLITFLAGVGLVFFSFVVIFSSLKPFYAIAGWWALHLMIFASIAMVQFAYHFPENYHERESRAVLVLCTAVACAVYPYYIYKTMSMDPKYSFEGQFFVFFNTPEVGIVIGMEILWMLVVFVRNASRISGYEYRGLLSRWLERPVSVFSLAFLAYLFARAWVAVVKIAKAREKSARAIRNMVLVFISPIILIFTMVMAYGGHISWEIVAHILGAGFMVAAFVFIILYINNSSERSTFMVKLVGISLGAVLVALGLAANITLMIKEDAYEHQRIFEVEQCRRALLQSNRQDWPKNVEYILRWPLGDEGESRQFEKVFARGPDINASILTENLGEPETRNLKVEDIEETERRFRKVHPLDAERFYVHYDFLQGKSLYEIGFSYMDYRRSIHETGLILIYIILGSVVFVVSVFPAFFRESLVKPLNRLLEGVSRVNNGDLTVVVPVQVEDEIGFLSSSFNRMVRSILEGERKLKESLDYQVRLTESYSCFVPREFLEFLSKDSITEIELGDNIQAEMSILFSDIRSFTMLSENMTPQENFNFLNSCFSRIGPVVRQNKGFVDKYIGDAIMALFPNKPEDAVNAAIGMQRVIDTYNRDREKRGHSMVRLGIGIHTGLLMLGTIGEHKRMEGTVISDAVNLTARLEGLTKVYGARVIISARTKTGIENGSRFPVRYLDRVRVKGKMEWVDIFEVLIEDAGGSVIRKFETKGEFERGVSLYQNGEIKEALRCFSWVIKEDPYDSAADLYVKRCRDFQRHGIPDEWRGITALDEK